MMFTSKSEKLIYWSNIPALVALREYFLSGKRLAYRVAYCNHSEWLGGVHEWWKFTK